VSPRSKGTGAGPEPGEDRGERRLERGAELILDREPLTGPAPLPDFARLLAARVRRGRLRAGAGVTGAVAVAAVTALAVLKVLTPVSYVVAGQAAITGSRIDAARTGEPTHVRFSEGTDVALAPGAELDVLKRTGRGAVLALEHGQARFSVVHRRGARWSVLMGPFAIEVTGTEFTVDWAPDPGRMVVNLKVGSVRVHGASVGGAVELNAGERLVATVSDHRVTLSPAGDATGLGAALIDGAGSPATAGGRAAGMGAKDLRAPAPSVSSGSPDVGSPPATAGSLPVAAGPGEGIAPSSTSRVVVDGAARAAGREPDARGALALWSPRHGGHLDLPEQRIPPLGATPGETTVRARQPVPEGPRIDPGPPATPAAPGVPQSLTLGGGGLFCVSVPAQYTFEQPAAGLSVPSVFTMAFSGPRLDRSHSWCGESSIRVDATFDDSGRQNFFGRFPNETGQLIIKLDHPTDLTGHTVTMHVFVEGPWDARFSAELAAVDQGRWISNEPSRGLSPGRWWTISHHFTEDNAAGVPGSSNPYPYPRGGRSAAAEVDRLALAIRTTGERRSWKGAVFVDDISWR